MKAVILAGGLGTRISEETVLRPKPMVEIGGKPILWHIMKSYSACGINDFVICAGYKGYMIKEYFANYIMHTADVTFDLQRSEMHVRNRHAEPWRVTIVDTGEKTMTGGRLRRVREYIDDEPFCFTYGDGVSNVDIKKLLEFHKKQGCDVTLTAVQPPGRFGALVTEGDLVKSFTEKPVGDGGWVNGGFFVMEPAVLNSLSGDDCVWESGPLPKYAAQGELACFRHSGFWYAMDTVRDKSYLEELWASGKAPWKTWE